VLTACADSRTRWKMMTTTTLLDLSARRDCQRSEELSRTCQLSTCSCAAPLNNTSVLVTFEYRSQSIVIKGNKQPSIRFARLLSLSTRCIHCVFPDVNQRAKCLHRILGIIRSKGNSPHTHTHTNTHLTDCSIWTTKD